MAHGVYAAATPSPTPGSPLPHPNHSRCHCAGAICAATSCGDGDDSCCCFVRHTLPLLRTKEDGAHRASPSVVFRSMTSAAGGRERQWRRVWTTPLRTPPRQHAQHERTTALFIEGAGRWWRGRIFRGWSSSSWPSFCCVPIPCVCPVAVPCVPAISNSIWPGFPAPKPDATGAWVYTRDAGKWGPYPEFTPRRVLRKAPESGGSYKQQQIQ